MRSKILLYSGLACTVLVLAPTTVAAAATGPPAGRPAADFPALTVTIPLIPLPSGVDVSGTATCPAGTVVLSGGAYIAFPGVRTAINASAPAGTTAWKAYANNFSGVATTFTVYAVCAPKPAGYTRQMGSSFGNLPGTQTAAGAACPGTDVVTGGGVIDTHNVKIDMASSYPAASDEWIAAVSNNSLAADFIKAVAICASPAAFPGYAIQTTTAPNPAGAQTSLTENCTAPAVPLGGGNQTSATASTGIWMKATRPFGAAWRGGENNDTDLVPNLTVYAICAT
jgi:hypothetical protein